MNEFDALRPAGPSEWILPKTGRMRVPVRIYADTETIDELRRGSIDPSEWNALRQLRNVACLPGIVNAALALPDVHPGYGFPIGGVGAFDPRDGIAVVGGVGFDINCGVRLLATPLSRAALPADLDPIVDDLYRSIPAGLGSKGSLALSVRALDAVLRDGALDAVRRGYGVDRDLEYIEEGGRMEEADPSAVSALAKQRQAEQLGTLGSGNHYLELQYIDAILDAKAAAAYGLREDQVVLSIHTGSRALGHQIGQDSLKEMANASRRYGLEIAERELVGAPIQSPEGERYLGAVAAGANCAFANRQVIAHLARESLHRTLGIAPDAIRTVYDIGHNSAKFEEHPVDGERRRLLVHRKGATRAFGPGRAESPAAYRAVGHPTIVGGTMGTASYIMRGTPHGMLTTFGSGIHGAGRALSRKQAAKRFWGATIIEELAGDGIRVRAHSARGVAEEAPGAYKDVDRVVAAAEDAGINVRVARLRPLAVVKG